MKHEATVQPSASMRPVPHRAPDLYVPHKRIYTLRFPFTRFGFRVTRDMGEALIAGREHVRTSLRGIHRNARGEVIGEYDLGSGLYTNAMTLAEVFDFNCPAGFNTRRLANYHSSGIGTNAAAPSDITLQTPIAGIAAPVVAGAQTVVSAPNLQKYQSSGLISYNVGGPYSVTEWGLFLGPTLSASTGSPFTACSAAGATVTGTPLTASSGTVQGSTGSIVVAGTVWNLVIANTTAAFTFGGGAGGTPTWFNTADGTAGATPGATSAFTLRPVMVDHRIFGILTMNTGDSMTYPWQVQVPSGG